MVRATHCRASSEGATNSVTQFTSPGEHDDEADDDHPESDEKPSPSLIRHLIEEPSRTEFRAPCCVASEARDSLYRYVVALGVATRPFEFREAIPALLRCLK